MSFIPTANEYIALPTINEETANIEDLTFLHMGLKGMIEVSGSPFIQPFIEGENHSFTWSKTQYWIPSATSVTGAWNIEYLTPIKERGFALKMTYEAKEDRTLTWGVKINPTKVIHCVNEDKTLECQVKTYYSNWSQNTVYDFYLGSPLFSLAYMVEGTSVTKQNTVYKEEKLKKGESAEFIIYFGLGFEEVASTTSAKEMLRQGYEKERQKTIMWLSRRTRNLKNPKINELYNTNLFFCIFYSTGLTLDTEELICATSRSPRYYVSAAYWDRDSLLWAFPAILDVDTSLAKEILLYVFSRQRKNIGTHSRYIDGTVLEPGFELDELMSPILALYSYLKKTQDNEILEEINFIKAVKQILTKLEEVKAENEDLYATFLQPTDDEHVYEYLTYDNVLVYKAFMCLSEILKDSTYITKAQKVKEAIYKNCIFDSYFAWSVDLKGNHDVYDEPPGSLQLLPYYGFCSFEDEIWKKTVEMIRSSSYSYSFYGYPIAQIGCPHAPHPWILSFCNSILCGFEEEAIKQLELVKMDNLIACESVDEYSGECTTGAAFATCAGFLCHCLLLNEEGRKQYE